MAMADITAALDASDLPAHAIEGVARMLADEGVEILDAAPEEADGRPGGRGRRGGPAPGHQRSRPDLPARDRPGAAAHRPGRGRAGQGDRGRAVRRGEAGRAACRCRSASAGRAGPARRRRAARQAAADRGQPAAGGVHRQALHRPRAGLPRPDPGGQPRPDPGGGEVRLHQGLQVLHVRHLVDPAGHHPRDRRPGAHDPDPGAHGRDDQQDGAGAAPAASGPRAGRRPRTRSPPRWG